MTAPPAPAKPESPTPQRCAYVRQFDGETCGETLSWHESTTWTHAFVAPASDVKEPIAGGVPGSGNTRSGAVVAPDAKRGNCPDCAEEGACPEHPLLPPRTETPPPIYFTPDNPARLTIPPTETPDEADPNARLRIRRNWCRTADKFLASCADQMLVRDERDVQRLARLLEQTYRAGTAEAERLREAAKSFRQETAAMLEALEPGEVPAAIALRYIKAREDLDAALGETKERLTP